MGLNKIKIVKSDVFDLRFLAVLWKKMISEIYPQAVPNVDVWMTQMEKYMAFEDYRCYHALVGDMRIGFIDGLMFHDPATDKIVAMGNHFYVLPKHRGVAGLLLYRRLIKVGKEHGAEAIELISYANKKCFWESKGMHNNKYYMRRDI